MKRRTIVMLPMVIALLVIAFRYFTAEKVTNPVTGKTARVGLSSEQEEILGLQTYREVLSQAEVVQSGGEHALVTRVASRLAPTTGAEAKDFQWQVSLVQSRQPNAFCLPGGKIVVYTGILPFTKSEGGLAAVMGHEMAHAVARHGSQRLLRTSLAQTFLMGANLSMGDLDPQQRQAIMAALGAGAQYGVLLPFSRQHETESDQLGLLYMARAGYDPREAISFWERMSQAGGSQPPAYMSTHPSHERRIQDLQDFMPKALAEYEKAKGGPDRIER
jgi:metalloendopeptidase OMA1, mitochondrial